MLLFVLACGLAVTLGLMNFVNLAHGAFAMAGGYICAILVNRYGVPFFAGLPLAFLASAAVGFVLERLLYRHLYSRPHLDQVLFTVGLVFMSVAACDYVMGSSQVFINLPHGAAGPDRPVRRRHRPLPADDHRHLRPAHDRAAADAVAHALRQPPARGRGRSARRRRSRHQRAVGVRADVCIRLRPCRAWRRARRGDPRPRSAFPAEVHDLLPDRRDRRRLLQHHRARSSPRCCSASATSPANITCRSSAPSSSTP